MAAANFVRGATSLLHWYSRTTAAQSPSPTHFVSLLSPKPPPIAVSSVSILHSFVPISRGKSTARSIRCFCTVGDASVVVDSSSANVSPSPPSTESISISDPNAIMKTVDLLDIRVGRILKAWRHPDADSLYVEEVDIGEPEPRTICSGLVKYVPLDDLQGKLVVVLTNLKPRNMRGVKSCGMLMAASDALHENVELLVPAEGSLPGERIWFGLEGGKEEQPIAATPNQVQKKKVWESIQPHLKTDISCTAMLGAHVMWTTAGPVVSSTLKNASIS